MAAEVVLLGGTVVLVISEPMLVRPDSELADQFPLDEFGSSLPMPDRLNRRCADVPRNLTPTFIVAVVCTAEAKAILFSEEEYEAHL